MPSCSSYYPSEHHSDRTILFIQESLGVKTPGHALRFGEQYFRCIRRLRRSSSFPLHQRFAPTTCPAVIVRARRRQVGGTPELPLGGRQAGGQEGGGQERLSAEPSTTTTPTITLGCSHRHLPPGRGLTAAPAVAHARRPSTRDMRPRQQTASGATRRAPRGPSRYPVGLRIPFSVDRPQHCTSGENFG